MDTLVSIYLYECVQDGAQAEHDLSMIILVKKDEREKSIFERVCPHFSGRVE